jgi:hypothetical protein
MVVEVHYKTSWPAAHMHHCVQGAQWTGLPGALLTRRAGRTTRTSCRTKPVTAGRIRT